MFIFTFFPGSYHYNDEDSLTNAYLWKKHDKEFCNKTLHNSVYKTVWRKLQALMVELYPTSNNYTLLLLVSNDLTLPNCSYSTVIKFQYKGRLQKKPEVYSAVLLIVSLNRHY